MRARGVLGDDVLVIAVTMAFQREGVGLRGGVECVYERVCVEQLGEVDAGVVF